MTASSCVPLCAIIPSSPANKSLRGSRGPEAGVRGIPSPFIKIFERGRETPPPTPLPLVPMRKDFLDEVPDTAAPQMPRGSAVDSLMMVTATDEFTDRTQGMRDR